MIITNEELFEFVKDKIECMVAQIKNRQRRIGTGTYRVNRTPVAGKPTEYLWILAPQNISIHPLDLILENQKVLQDKSRHDAVARKLNCSRTCIISFNNGLGGELNPPKKDSIEYKFFMYGRKVRTKHAKKALKKREPF